MIWSVSTSARRSGTPVPVITRTAFIVTPPHPHPISTEKIGQMWPCSSVEMGGGGWWGGGSQVLRGGEVAGGGGRRGDSGGHEVGASAAALPTLEVAVARARRPLARRELVGVHRQAHRATGLTP